MNWKLIFLLCLPFILFYFFCTPHKNSVYRFRSIEKPFRADQNSSYYLRKTTVSICVAVRSKPSWKSLHDSSLQKLLIPSIQRTITERERKVFDIRLYLAADSDDFFFLHHKKNIRTEPWLRVFFKFYKKIDHKIPFNRITKDAFLDGTDYFVRVNDDTEFTSIAWIEEAVRVLKSFEPSNVGVVGPICKEGNTKILTHDMVHRTHLEIFKTYYPEIFSSWWVDDWISSVYGKKRTMRLSSWHVKHHTHVHGRRYMVQEHERQHLPETLRKDQETLFNFLIQKQHGGLDKTVVVIGKGESAKPVQKHRDNIIVTVNHALGFQNYSDYHFHLDWYFHQVSVDFFCRAKNLVLPTYFHTCSNGRCNFVHASLWLSKLKFTGNIFLVQLPDGPQANNIEVWTGDDALHSSGDLAFAWMLRRGFRKFESYGIGGNGYANFFISNRYKRPKRFVQNTNVHQNHIRKRIRKYMATWTQHLETTQLSETEKIVNLALCPRENGWGNLKHNAYGPTIEEAIEFGAGDEGVPREILKTVDGVKGTVPIVRESNIFF